MTRPMTATLDTPGGKVRTRTPRIFAVVAYRAEDIVMGGDTCPCLTRRHFGETCDCRREVYVRFATVIKRTDSLKTAHAAARRYGRGHGTSTAIYDLRTLARVA